MSAFLSKALAWVDYFMPSLEEAEELSSQQGALACGKHFLELGVRRAVVLKSGAQGSYLIRRKAATPEDVEVLHIAGQRPPPKSNAIPRVPGKNCAGNSGSGI